MDAEPPIEGRDVPEGQIVVQPIAEDEVCVNGTVLRESSSLATLRAGCSFYGISSSGSKQKCFKRLIEHSKKLELESVMAAAKEAFEQQERHPLSPVSAEVPSEYEQSQHRLTHVPYKQWCPSCLAHRARSDRHERSGESHAGAVPTISFDYFFTKSDGQAGDSGNPDTITALVVVDSHTGFVSCIPLEGKSQLDHANREIIKFVQMLGHSEVILHCDNEPSILQLKRLVLKTRQGMGLKTRESSSVAYDKGGNSLAENAVGRVRALACTLMHHVHGRLGIQLETSSAIWSWALRHSAWLISRFSVIRGATPYELAFGRTYAGELCEFGEPIFGYVIPTTKATAKWKRMLFLGKADIQNSYVAFDGQSILLTRSVRRINTEWRSHMAYYLHCRCFSWQYKAGFGARILPTMRKPVPKSVAFEVPLGPIEESALHDKDAEAVIQYAIDEQKAQEEQLHMSANDPLSLALREKLGEGVAGELEGMQVVDDDGPALPSGPIHVTAENPPLTNTGDDMSGDPGLAVPVTPPRDYIEIESPREPATSRAAEPSDEDSSKRQRLDESKRQRIARLQAEYEQRLCAVKIAYKEYFTMDDYETDLNLEQSAEEDEDWVGEDAVVLTGIPEYLWSDAPVDQPAPGSPEKWIDDLADKVEIDRLCSMQVLVPQSEFQGEITGSLTTKMVRDWRLKSYGEGEGERKRWMRRSRLVAREFATTKRLDTFSPATGTHTANLLQLKYLGMKSKICETACKEDYDVVMGSLDVRDAFLQVEQDDPVRVVLQGQPFIIKRNLPGQRLGAKQWFLCLKSFLMESMNFEFCPEQPCLARTPEASIMIHVDDILFVGLKSFWNNVFLKKMKERFSVSHDELKGPGSSITFLRRKIMEVEDGLVLAPGTTVDKVVSLFERMFGSARSQKVPCDASIQLPDNSQRLSEKDSKGYRSVVGLCLYAGRERPDLMYTIKELASYMSAPTLTSLARLRKMVGFMKSVGDIGLHLPFPEDGQGKVISGGQHRWVLESFSDADWSANKQTRRSTSCGIHFINGCFMYSSSRSQRVVSLSSCESELHSLVSCVCDGIFIKACAAFVLDEQLEHFQFTDSSSARQLASRQGSGKVRHLSGKLLWIQEKTADNTFKLRQVPTTLNVADIGTKALSRQRLFYLLYECELVFIADFSRVGANEHAIQDERRLNSQQLKRISKAILRMSIAMGVAGGLESAGPVAAMAQSDCANMDNETKDTSWFSFAIAVLVICMGTVFSKLAFRAWKWIEEKIKKLENQVLGVSNELEQAQIQLADHYEYAADLNGRIEDCNALATDASNRIDTVMARQTGFEQETIEGFNALEETSNCVRYGLMEIGGFVRNAKLTAEQYRHMLTQERGNLVLWNHRNRADSTDPIVHQQEDHEGGEEESPTTDVEDNQSNRPTGMEALLQNMRADQNQALAAERWHEASMIQQAICLVLDSTLTEGFSTRISNEIRNIFQRLYRFHRNRGDDERRDRFRLYVEDMQSLMI